MSDHTINSSFDGYIYSPWKDPYSPPYQTQVSRKVKKITRTIEKYDPQGQLTGREVITEEEEVYETPIQNDPYRVTCAAVGTPLSIEGGARNHEIPSGTTSGTVTYKNDAPFTLLNGGMGVLNGALTINCN